MGHFDWREYQTVLLAALLHDIGKFLHRTKPGYVGKHEIASADFLKNEAGSGYKTGLINDSLYDLTLVEWLIRCHHSQKGIKIGQLLEQYRQMQGAVDLSDRRLKSLLRIVRNADNYSCAERNYRKQEISDSDKRRTALLNSIFTDVSIDNGKFSDLRYPLKWLDPLDAFPKDISQFSDEAIKEHAKHFTESIPNLNGFYEFDKIIYILLDHLEKYLWCIPSDTRYERPDISLYDHLKTSAAIAACLYKKLYEKLEEPKFGKRIREFTLIAGDFSGIQNYILDITSRVSTGAAKGLRARSFFITAFCEATIHKILHSLKLPPVCNLFSAGGKFILLAPNTDDVDVTLKEVKLDIENEIYNRYFNQFTFLMTWKRIDRFRPDMDIRNFCSLADEMFHALETEKVEPFKSLFCSQANLWATDYFQMPQEDFISFAEKGDCKVCGKRPGTLDLEGTEICEICAMNRSVGGDLAKRSSSLLGYVNESCSYNERQKIPLFSKTSKREGYCLHLLDGDLSMWKYYLGYELNPGRSQQADIPGKYIANHVPTDESNNIIPFDELAKNGSKWSNPHDGKTYGNPMLGVLKADVDNLGLLFSKGLGEKERTDKRTVSRFLTLSRMMELFFSGWVGQIMSIDKEGAKGEVRSALKDIENKDFLEDYLATDIIDFQNIYTVYTGGDDLILIGPWETMIVFSLVLNANFRKFTCESDSFTLSAGLSFVKPKFPIASAMRDADELLNRSKKKGKGRITLFNTTIEWNNITKFINLFLFVNHQIHSNDSKINNAFIYRLLEYHLMAQEYIEGKKVNNLKYVSLLNYDLGRNILLRNNAGKIVKGQYDFLHLIKIVDEKQDKNSIVYNLKIPCFWSIYRNRRFHE